MHRILSMIAVLALAAFAPLGAQERAADTSALGRQGEGIPTNADPSQAQGPAQDEGLTTREGIEGEGAGQAGQPGQAEGQRDVTGQPGVTERAAQADQREATTGEAAETDEYTDEGGAMPTTASALPLVALAGLAALGLGLGLRAAARRS